MIITSSAFEDGKAIPAEYTCQGHNANPPLAFHGVPLTAKSLVLIMEDPDVPRSLRPDGLYIHWMVWNMPAATTGIDANALAPGISGVNTGGNFGYTGPCPPDKEHRYYFRLYALDTELMIPSSAQKGALVQAMQGHILDQAVLMGRYVKS